MLHRDVGPVSTAGNSRRVAFLRHAGIALSLAVVMTACTPTVKLHGYRLDRQLLTEVVPGETSKEEVLRVMGSPSSIGTFDDNDWYYVSQTTEQESFYQSEITAQDVVVIAFDERGIVNRIDQRTLDDAVDVVPSSDETRTLGKALSLVEQLVGNIGRFSDRDGPVGGN